MEYLTEKDRDPGVLKICVQGISPGAGQTFISEVLAYYLGKQGERQGRRENSPAKGMFKPKRTKSEPEERSIAPVYHFGRAPENDPGLSTRLGRRRMYAGVCWVPGEPGELIRGTAVCDGLSSWMSGAEYGDFDFIVGVIDPLPSGLIQGATLYAELRELGREHPGRVIWIVNKHNPGVNAGEPDRFLKEKFTLRQDWIPAEKIYDAQYSGMPLFELDGLSAVEALTQHIVCLL